MSLSSDSDGSVSVLNDTNTATANELTDAMAMNPYNMPGGSCKQWCLTLHLKLCAAQHSADDGTFCAQDR